SGHGRRWRERRRQSRQGYRSAAGRSTPEVRGPTGGSGPDAPLPWPGSAPESRMSRPALALAFLLLPLSAAAAEPLALQCERLFEARSGKLLPARTVVVREGRIAEVLEGRVEVPG